MNILALSFLLFFSSAMGSVSNAPLSEAVKRGEDPVEFLDNIGQTDFSRTEKFNTQNVDDEGSRAQNLGGSLIVTTIGSGDDASRGVVIQSDGKILSIGRFHNGTNNDFVILRYHPDGELDTTFNTTGKTFTSFGVGDDTAHSVALDTSGRAVVVGRADRGNPDVFDFAVARFATSGSLDTSFNTIGKVTTGLITGADFARAVSIQGDGAILAAGYARVNSFFNFAITRYTSDGILDTSFNTSGKTIALNGISDNGANALVLQADNRIVAGGASYNGSNWDFALVRLFTNGVLDTSFRTTGILTDSLLSGDDIGYAIAIHTTGRLILGGGTHNGSKFKFGTVRWTTDGVLDTSFNTTGKLSSSLGTGDERVYGMGVQTDGVILGAGYSFNGTDNDFSIARYLMSGTIDTTFNTKGFLIQPVLGAEDTAQGIAQLGDGYFVLSGRTHNGSNLDVAISRYNTDGSPANSGKLDKSLTTLGKLSSSIGTGDNILFGIVEQPDRTIIGVGTLSEIGTTNVGFGILRFTQNGTLDTSFNTTGYNLSTYGAIATGHVGYGVVLQSDGKLISAGKANAAANGENFLVARYLTNGAFDTTFNTTGKLTFKVGSSITANNSAYGILLQTDGNIIVAGSASNGADTDFAIARLLTNGVLDTTFNTTGKRFHVAGASVGDDISAIALQTDGFVVAVGNYEDDQTLARDTVLIRYHTNGVLDTSFNTTGLLKKDLAVSADDFYYGVTIDEAGRIVGVGAADTKMAVSRYNTNGSLDTSFNTSGNYLVVNSSVSVIRGVSLSINSKIVAAGWDGSTTQFMVLRFSSNGVLDTTFNTVGRALESLNSSHNKSYGIVIQRDGKIVTGGSTLNGATSSFTIMRFWP